MVGALWTGISGLQGQQRALDNESNNIANVNTLGYKASRIAFSDQMYQDDIGKGVDTFDVEKLYTQGNLKVTGVDYDMALSGDGFFQVSNGSEFYYTRAGNFRMGESGKLENAGGLTVQGWAMSALNPEEDVKSTDENATRFTEPYNKLLGNAIFRNSSDITTKVAKATDYTETAEADSVTVFSGAHQKNSNTKISDVEELVTEYNNLLTQYNNADPKPASTESKNQRDLLDFDLDSVSLTTGDQIYVYIGSDKYTADFDTDEMTTFKKLVDKISNVPGLKAYITDGDSVNDYPMDTQDIQGKLVIEGIIPGKDFSVTEFGWIDQSDGNSAKKGTVQSIQEAIQGTGLTAIANVETALAEVISGKQKDVYTPADLFEIDTIDDKILSDHTFYYSINIYDKDKEVNLPIPNDNGTPPQVVPLTINGITNDMDPSTAIDVMVSAINSDTSMSSYVEAFNINGNLVVKTLDSNSDVEFTSSMSKDVAVQGAVVAGGADVQEVQAVSITGPATSDGYVQVGNVMVAVTNGDSAATISANIAAAAATIKEANPDISNIADAAGSVNITWAAATGNIGLIPVSTTASGIAISAAETTQGDDTLGSTSQSAITGQDIPRNATYSGRDGAGAEFLAMTTTINQAATKSDIQLRLDTLLLTDSAFGEFSVDETGLITMKQDGAEFAVGQVAIAKFTDNRGLEAIGGNLAQATNRSGQAIFNMDNEKTANIKGGTLELSTSDLSESLVNLMVFQRAFEANSKSITTSDAILNTLIQMKR